MKLREWGAIIIKLRKREGGVTRLEERKVSVGRES